MKPPNNNPENIAPYQRIKTALKLVKHSQEINDRAAFNIGVEMYSKGKRELFQLGHYG